MTDETNDQVEPDIAQQEIEKCDKRIIDENDEFESIDTRKIEQENERDKNETSNNIRLEQTDEKSGFNIHNAQPLTIESFPDKTKNDTLKSTIPNLRHMLKQYGINVRYNTVKKKSEIVIPGQKGAPDNADNAALAYISSLAALNGMNTSNLSSYLLAIANENQANPVADWINSRPWDGQDRLQALYDTITADEDWWPYLKDTLIYKWLLSLVAAVLKPIGFKARGVLVFQGPQSIGKTTWFYHLIDDPILRENCIKLDHHLDAANKDSLLIALSHWIVEIGELDSSFKKDVARLKGFITGDKDKIRQPYARTASEYQRRTVFCATVNSKNFLIDDTGNTRWWVIPVKKIDFNHNIDMQQVFAQLAVDFHDGKEWWLNWQEEAELELLNKQFRIINAVYESLSELIDIERSKSEQDSLDAFTAKELLAKGDIHYPTNMQCKDCHSFMREHIGEPKKIQGSYKWRVAFKEEKKWQP